MFACPEIQNGELSECGNIVTGSAISGADGSVVSPTALTPSMPNLTLASAFGVSGGMLCAHSGKLAQAKQIPNIQWRKYRSSKLNLEGKHLKA